MNHLINSRPLTSFTPIERELDFDADHNYLFDLSHLGILNLVGDKAMDFLQGQLSCDLRLVSNTRMVQGAQCNLQGRILSLLDVIQWDHFKLILPKDMLELTRNSLIKTAMLSRVTIQELKGLKILGFHQQNPKDIKPHPLNLPDSLYNQVCASDYCYYHLGAGFYILLIPEDQVPTICQSFIEKNQFKGSLAWHTLRLYQQQIDIYPESRALFLPHRLDLHLNSFISFDKGCYKGQEIIARTHYKATLKHELKLYQITSDEKVFSGQKIYPDKEDREIGEVIDYSLLGENRYLIAVSMLKSNTQDWVRLEGQNGLVELL